MSCSVEEPPGGSHGSGKLRPWGTPVLGEGRPPTETPGHIWSPGEPITGPFKKITASILNRLFLWEWFLCSWVFVSSILHTINCTYKCLLEGTISHWQLIQKVPEANCTPKWEVSGVINYSLIIFLLSFLNYQLSPIYCIVVRLDHCNISHFNKSTSFIPDPP